MKTIFRIALAAAVVATMAGCKAFRTLTDSRLKTAQGAPYELIVVCPQQEWTGEVGDTLRAIFTAPIPYLNQTEPLFDVLRVTERGFTGMVADHRNILKVLKDPTLTESSVAVQYNVTSDPQIATNTPRPARASSSTLTPTRARSRFRPERCSPPATSSPPAFPARRTVPT